ncbi:MAG: methyltransferase [Anaerofustis stercorihominis]|nr:methyltransferase [Anaerofustis stercorihominis]
MAKIPFNESELNIVAEKPGRGAPTPIYDFPVTPKEAILANYRKEPVWMPMGLEAVYFIDDLIGDNKARGAISGRRLAPEEIGGKDMFGIEWVYVPKVGGSIVKPGKPTLDDANNWKEVIQFPDVDTWDWEGAAERFKPYFEENKDIYVRSMIFNGFFERLISWMDFEAAATAMIDEDQQDAVKEIFDNIADLYIKIIDKHLEYYPIDGVNFHDDWGAQRAPFFSLATVREMLVPAMKKFVDHVHEKGLFVDFHSCGCIEMLVPAMIEIGIDSWGGQPMNDYEKLYDLYGDKIILGVIPKALPENCTDEQAKENAKEFVERYTKPGTCVFISGSGAANLANRTWRAEVYRLSRMKYSE